VKHLRGVKHLVEKNGRPWSMGAIQDITDIKQSENALKASEAELRRANQYLTIAQQLSLTGSYTRDVATDQQNLSDQMYRIWEFDPAKEVTHEMVLARIHPEDLPAFREAWSAAVGARQDIKIAFRIVTDTGAVKHFRTVSQPMTDASGRLTYVGATQDVTEMKLAEESANRARAELAHVARVSALNVLTASIAHEVSQPLSGIVTNASTCLRMLAGDPPNVEGAQVTAQRTIRDASRATEVIQRLRALFGRRQLSIDALDLNDAAREVLALSSSELQRRRIGVRTILAEDLPVVNGDRVQLQQVILNLILNAADAMSSICETPPSLVVETRRDDTNRVRLSVCDTGVGIEPGNAEKIFDAFYTTKADGMGIGLSVSRSIIQSHDGRLWATANEGPGATFAFSLPCRL
jgi:signal transduction histidine kinase